MGLTLGVTPICATYQVKNDDIRNMKSVDLISLLNRLM